MARTFKMVANTHLSNLGKGRLGFVVSEHALRAHFFLFIHRIGLVRQPLADRILDYAAELDGFCLFDLLLGFLFHAFPTVDDCFSYAFLFD